MRLSIIGISLINSGLHTSIPHFIILKQSYLKSISKLTTFISNSTEIERTSSINITLIIISNTSLLNPGPSNNNNNNTSNHISVMYHNVEGLIPFSNLADKCPNLDQTEIYELKSSIAINKPDVIVLNETWLKEPILDNEILDTKFYKLYRLDRSQKTHPIDPYNVKKFRKNGGGFLIGVNNQLVLTSNVVEIKCSAEFLAIEFVLKDKTKMIVSTCYRLGTLGRDNFEEISKATKTLTRKRGVKKFILIGDFNFPHINWNT